VIPPPAEPALDYDQIPARSPPAATCATFPARLLYKPIPDPIPLKIQSPSSNFRLLSDIQCRVELNINNAFEDCGLKAQRIVDPRDGTGLGKGPSSPDLRPAGVTPFAAFFVTPSNPSP